jgi:hypothetical protein
MNMRWTYVVGALVLLLIGIPAATVWYGLSFKPAYWEPVEETRPDAREGAVRFEQSLRNHVPPASETSRSSFSPTVPLAPGSQAVPGRREPTEWTEEITQAQLNAWLRSRVTEWGANRGVNPRLLELLGRSQVSIDVGVVEVGVPFTKASISGVVRMRYRPVTGGDGRVRLMAEDAHVGLAPVPISMAIDNLLSDVPGADEGEIERLRARASAIDLVVPLRDGRQVGVVDMALIPGQAIVTFRTLVR